MSRLALGTAQFGLDYGISNDRGRIPKEEVFSILDLAANSGIDTLDTAPAYGTSEEVIGEYLKKHTNKFSIVSKLSKESFSNVKGSVDGILRKLGVSDIYGILFHHFDDFKNDPDHFRSLQDMKAAGKIKKIGFSLYSTADLEYLFDSDIDFDLIQVPYNVFDQRFEKYFNKLAERGIEIHIRSVFMQGLFFMDMDKLDPFFSNVKKDLEYIHSVAEDLKISMVELCLGFVLLNKKIDKVIVGVDSINNLRGIISASKDYERVRSVYNGLTAICIKDEKCLLPFNWKLAPKGDK